MSRQGTHIWIDGIEHPSRFAARVELGLPISQRGTERLNLAIATGHYLDRSVSLSPPTEEPAETPPPPPAPRRHLPGESLIRGHHTHRLGAYIGGPV
jgi:hypothetical protein